MRRDSLAMKGKRRGKMRTEGESDPQNDSGRPFVACGHSGGRKCLPWALMKTRDAQERLYVFEKGSV